MIEYRIRIDVKGQRTLYTDGEFTTGDVQAYRLRFLFYDDGVPYDVSGCSLVLRGKRSDGVVISDVGHIEADGTAYYDVSGSLYAVAGSLSVEVALTGAADEYLTAKELIFNVRGGHGDGDPATEDTAPMISKLLAEIKQTADDVAAVQSDFDSHVSAAVMAHPDGSVTAEKLQDGAVTAAKLGTDVKAVLNNKVDKETGKGLSANDFTDACKTKLEGIAENAEVNVQSDWNETDSAKDAYIHNKPSIYTRAESDNRYLPQDTAAGTVPQTEYAIAANAKNYQVYGNSVQDGTPAPDSPVAVQSVGDLVTSGEYAGKYAITETITNGDTTETITVYLDEPLRKLGNYADYIDYEQQKVIRNIVKIRLTGPFEKYNDIIWQSNTGKFILKTGKELCSHFKYAQASSQFGINNKNLTGYYVCVSQVKANMGLTLAEFNTWLTENEVYYYAVLVTPTEESITLAPMPLGAGTNSITTGTAIQPSNVIVDYYQNPTDVINSLKTAIVAMQSQTE